MDGSSSALGNRYNLSLGYQGQSPHYVYPCVGSITYPSDARPPNTGAASGRVFSKETDPRDPEADVGSRGH
ncbi:hypothetical protein NDU88_005421 [Pleurodeles waltl]|uniref:Uncharacterized protein n=1 Tax=Pleurodeles waltl TaxID=8319 RepID=A0AAV7QH55_PLEWA|nr:hypothetical protein NDU88_005421 [Pleurodeles waltl]